MKKIFRVLLLILIFSTCGVLSACTKDNYKRLAFEVSYSLDNENWKDVSNGNISLSYGDGNGDISLDKEGNTLTGTIYLKVNVKGVKAKYLDKILVQNTGSGSNTGSGLIASGTMVDVNAVVPLSINLDAKSLDGDYINTTIKLTETSSNKSCDVDFDLNPSLKEMSMNKNYLPTVGLGGRTTLSTNFLTFTPFNTAQKNVVYSIDSVGFYEETASVAGGANDSTSYRGIPYNGTDITITDGVISVSNNYNLLASNHIVRVKATSVDNAEISTTFDVYITPNNMFGFAPEVRYANNYDLGITNPVLYVNSTKYGSNSFRVLSGFAGSNIYFGNGVLTSVYGKKLAYKLNFYVDGYKYNLINGEEYHGVVIKDNEDGTYTVTATETDYELYKTVSVEFRYELEGVSYTTNSNVATYSKSINIDKAKLATGMALTMDYGAPNPVQENLVNGNSVDVEVYSTNNKVWLTFNALPNDLTGIDSAEFVLSDYTGLDITNLTDNIAYNGSALMVAFADNGTSSTSAKITVQLACNPHEFEGETQEAEYITVTINLTYVVTANEVLAFVDEGCNTSVNDSSVDRALNITADRIITTDGDTGAETEINNYLYLKVAHSNVNLDASTIKLTSTNAGITFDGAGKTEITLDDDSIITTPVSGGTIFKIPVFASENGLNGTIQVTVADGNVVLPNSSNTTIAVRSVKLADEESLNVTIDSSNATNAAIELGKNRVDNEHQNFAVVRGTTQNFRVFDKNNDANVIKNILVTTNTTDYTSLYTTYGFSDRALSNLVPNGTSASNYFGFYTLQNGTQVLEITVNFYALIDGVIKLQSKTLVAEFAVYTPINRVEVDATNSVIAYMKDFLEGSSTQISYNATNADVITNTIYFSKMGEESTLGTVQVGNVNTISAVYVEENGTNQTLTDVAYTGLAGVSMVNNATNNHSGKVNVQLTQEITTTGVTIRFMVYRLGELADSSAYWTVSFKKYKPADRVVVTGDADVLDKTSVANTTYLYLSTIDDESKSKEFYAAAEWDNANDGGDLRFTQLGYQLYRYAQNADGSLTAVDGKPLDPVPYSFSGLDVTINEDGKVTVEVTENIGGIFKLVIGTMDSCVETGNVKTFATYAEIIVSISNGETAANPYTITTVEELEKLNNSNKYFVLAKDITVDMASTVVGGGFEISPIVGFTGTLTGTRQIIANNNVVTRTYTLSLYLNVANTVETDSNNYSGLFAVLGEGATVKNLNIVVNYSGTANDVVVGAVAGKNLGLIENVNLTVSSSNITFGGENIAFGSYVGDNSVAGDNTGSINLAEATLVHNTLNIQSGAINNYIGGVAGLNSGLIKGNYLGKESLNSIDYTTILNIDIINTNRTESAVEYSVGGVAGLSTGVIFNSIVGGRINVEDVVGVNNGNVNLGGVVGNITVEDNAVNTCAVLGLSLVANTNHSTVAGIVAKADIVAKAEKGTINNSRVIFATVKYATIGTVMSSIQGENVAGVVGEANNLTNVTLSTVESFISIYEDYNPLKGKNVAGISLGDAKVDRCFVYANMEATNELTILSTGVVENSYYIGFVNGYKTVAELKANKNKIVANNTTTNAYAVVLATDGYYSAYENKGYVIKVEKLAITEVDHDTLFKLTEDVVTNDNFNEKTYYTKLATGGYTIATSFVAGTTYYEINNYYAKANYILQENNAIAYNNNTYNAKNTYYYVDRTAFNYTVYDEAGSVVTDNSTLNLNINYYVNHITDDENKVYTDPGLLHNLMPNVYDASIVEAYRQLWNVNNNYNTVQIKENTLALPYLLVDSNPLMIVGPSDINISINQQYVEEISSVYINEEQGFNPSDYDIAETVLVNYFYAQNMLTGVNTHKLLSTEGDGLLSVDILPSADIVTGGVAFEIVRGQGLAYDCAEINGNEITFTGVSDGRPILVRCYSTFNADLSKYAIFFTEYGANALVPVNDNLYLDATNGAEYSLDLVTLNDTDKAKVNVAFNTNNIFAGSAYNSIIANGRTELLNALEIRWEAPTGVIVEKLSNQLDVAVGINNAELNSANNIIKFTLVLNTEKYFGQNYFANNSYIEIANTTVYVNVYKAAEGLTVSPTELRGQVGTTFPITASLQTSYVDEYIDDGTFNTMEASVVGNTFVMKTERTDGLNIAFECEDGSLAALNALLENAGVDYITELFNIVIGSTYQKGFGYNYDIKLELKDGFASRYIESEIVLNLNVYAQTDSNLAKNIKLTLQPAKLEGVELENYAANKKEPVNNYQSIITGAAETSVIEPGGLGGVMVARIQPSYADVTDVRILSEGRFIPSLSRNVYVMFEQLVYDNDTNTYRTIEGGDLIYDSNNNIIGRNLRKISEIKDGKTVYTGVVYIHTSLENFSGYETTMNVTLETKTLSGGNTWLQKPKTLTTKYVPGASLEYNKDNLDGNAYLIQKGSSNNTINVRLDGYQFNANPTITFEWARRVLNDNNVWNWETVVLTEKDGEFTAHAAGETLPDGAKVVYPTDYIDYVYDFNNLTTNANGSYLLPINITVNSNLPYAFKVNAKLSLTSSTESREENPSLYFVPTDYILTGLNVTNLVDGTLPVAINENKTVDLSINTRGVNDYTSILNSALVNSLAKLQEEANDKLEESQKYQQNDFFYNLFKVNNNVLSEYSRFFTPAVNNNKLTLLGSSPLRAVVSIQINYQYIPVYEDGDERIIKAYKLEFVRDGGRVLTTNFNLNVYDNSTEDVPIAIRSQEEFEAMVEGENYILMNDIVLTNYTPNNTAIASLDGNNYIIYIKDFALPSGEQTVANYGLFENLGTYVDEDGNTQKSILKNVIVSYGDKDDPDLEKEFNLPLVDSNISSVVFGGLVANNNGGLIYNSEVINLANLNRFNLFVYDNPSTNVTFGGLVGVNNGIITNSRVGRSSYTSVRVNSNGATITGSPITNIPALTFSIGNANSDDKNQFTSIAGGLVGENGNNGIVASSYVANTSLISYSIAKENSRLAGFVAENAGTVSYSYVKALESTINASQAYSTGAGVESRGNGSVAGFVHYNSGTISNSFANTVVTTASNFVSGFVYENRGAITESYAASTLNSELNNSSAEQPFVGVDDKNDVLSYGTLTNTYYYAPNSGVTQKETSLPKASALNTSNIQKANNLHGFVFVDSNSIAERNQGVWSYYVVNSYEKHILPELNNANMIAGSNRYLLPSGDSYANAAGYALGSANNPNIIRDAKEFAQVFTSGGNSSVFNGYVRIINNIDLTDLDIPTRTNFTLGSANSISSLEGNGMQINGIYLDVISPSTSEIGLFANIKNTYVKNLNLNFVSGTYSTLLATYSGGLAGKISDSVISNINLDGVGTTITGNNFAGGLAGLIEGESLIVGVRTNMNVSVNRTSTSVYNLYYNQADYEEIRKLGYHGDNYQNYLTTMSYAGALAGVIDIRSKNENTFNLSYIEIDGNRMSTSADYNIRADFAGGVAGYAGVGVNALRVKYNVGANDKIYGRYTAGGLFGVGLGAVTASQVTTEEDTQLGYDDVISEYILALNENNSGELKTAAIGNLNLVTSEKYAGGMFGVAINARINSSYSRASLTGKISGGLIGASVAASAVYSYAVPYVNLPQGWVCAGGLIGQAFGSGNQFSSLDDVKEFADYSAILNNNKNTGTVVQNAFSTIIIDVNNSNNVKNYEADGKFTSVNQNGMLDYFVAQSSFVAGGADNSSSVAQPLIGVYVATLKETAYASNGFNVKTGLSANIGQKEIQEVYDLNNVNHSATYNDLFGGWRNGYWAYNDNKYFPLLTEDEAINYTEIYQNNFNAIYANPSGSYIIKEDINVGPYYTGGNYIFDINFTGILVGDVEGYGKVPKLYNIQIGAVEEDNSGFFNTTTGATITGLEFVYGNSTSDGVTVGKRLNKEGKPTKVGYFGGVSATDNGSTFTQVIVRTESNNANLITVEDDSSVAGFGGIVGNATNTTMFNSIFNANVNLNLYSEKPEGASVGGLIGFGRVGETSEDAANFTLSGSRVGKTEDDIGNTTNDSRVFNIDIKNTKDTGTVNIGGIAGYVTGAAIAGCEVGQLESVRFNITNTASGLATLNFGGFAGYSGDTNIDGAVAKTSFVAKTFNEVGSAKIAGFVGEVNNTTGATSIQQAEVNFTADLFKLTAKDLVTSMGVAKGTNAKIYQSVFKGETSNETSIIDHATESNGKINESILAGGAIGVADIQSVLSEVVTDAVFTLGGTSIKITNMGGLVGSASGGITIDSCVAAGRLIPYGSFKINDGGTATNFKIGGLIGNAESVIDVKMTISLVSILTDGIVDSLVASLNNVNALFGEINGGVSNATLANIYYSSDYAMFAEGLEKELDEKETNPLYNLSAYTISRSGGDGRSSNSWKRPFATSLYTNWTIMTDAVPYPTALQSSLEHLGILETIASRYVYKEGSAFSPQVLNATNNSPLDLSAATNYRYYVIASATNSNLDCQLEFSGILNGIMLGCNETLLNVKLSNSTDDVYAGFIPQVGKHSAVANIHVRLSSPVNTPKEINGIIVGLNEGVVSNCSVQGANIEISGLGEVGLIVGKNTGFINLCYSTAEITDLSNFNGGSIVGIVSTNNGKLSSSYFTGYINNPENVLAAGVAYIPAEYNGGYKGFVYNCYNAGVIENIKIDSNDRSSSFSVKNGTFNANTGKNNFIDGFANSERLTTDSFLSVVDSSKIFIADSLQGDWRKVASIDNKKTEINTEAHSFGYNYGYPVHYLNKRDVNLVVNDVYFACYTGIGKSKTAGTEININNILEDEKVYNDAYKIPHFGVLTTLRALANKNLSFVIIYDLDGEIINPNEDSKYIKWENSIGAGDENNFTGVVVSNRYYNLNKLDENAGSDEIDYYRCTISNFSGSSLFTNIKNSTFAYINFGGDITLTTAGGALGDVVSGGENEDSVNTVTLSNIKFKETNVILDNTIEYMGGLLGKVNNFAVVNIDNLTTPGSNQTEEGSTSTQFVTLTAQRSPTDNDSYIGLIAGKNGGTINITDTSKLRVKFATTATAKNYTYESKKGSTFGGLIGQNKGVLNGKGVTLEVSMLNDKDTNLAYAVGGIVGNSDGGSVVNGVNVIFREGSEDNPKTISAINVGALTATNTGTSSFNNCAILKDKTISGMSGKDYPLIVVINNYNFGLLAAYNTGTLNINTLIVGDNKLISVNTYASEVLGYQQNIDVGIGGLIGVNDKGSLNMKVDDSFSIRLSANSINVGGLVGLYSGGHINININLTLEVGSSGDNVGGVFGKATEEISVIKDPTKGVERSVYSANFNIKNQDGSEINEIPTWKFLEGEVDFATVSTSSQTNNVGGLIGYFAGAGDKKLIGITNRNTIGYGKYSVEGSEQIILSEYDAVSNIGGVVGYVASASEVSNLSNMGEIGKLEEGLNNNDFEITQYKLAGSKDLSELTMNVGGVIGKIDVTGLTISNIVNTGDVRGYQNVGGLIGFASNVTISNASATDDSQTEETNAETIANNANVFGVMNVGGTVGLASSGVTIANIINRGSVYGNANVGGIVGYNYQSTITNSCVGNEEGSLGEMEVKGVIYRVTEGEAEGINSKQIIKNYIPTNIGGLVGFIGSDNSSTTLTNNKVVNVNITSAEETNAVISTVSNYMVQVVGEGDLPSYYYNDGIILLTTSYTNDVKEGIKNITYFNDIKSGFGGLAGGVFGGLNTNVTDKNTLENISINAQLGINVGTLFGYYRYVKDEVTLKDLLHTFNILGDSENQDVSKRNNLYIDGAYNIGGIIGYLDNSFGVSLSNEELEGVANIILQNSLGGMYVGGLLGKMNANTGSDGSNLSISSSSGNIKININTAMSYYMGGLIGRFEVNGSSVNFNGEVNGQVTNTVYKESSQNFGGLIGMLKIASSNSANEGYKDININGSHPYAFTVNTIENSNYYNGNSIYDSHELENEIYLVAQAYCVNLDSFSISPANSSWYNSNADNPLQSSYFGWAKDYTLFKTLQRCIPNNENGDIGWDAISPVYDASNVTFVATIANSQRWNGSKLGGDIKYTNASDKGSLADSDKYKDNVDDYICYTIYEDAENSPKLYSRIGIAELARDENGQYIYSINDVSKDVKEKLYDLSNNTYKHTTKGLSYFNWETFSEDDNVVFTREEGDYIYKYPKDYIIPMSKTKYNVKEDGSASDTVYFKFGVIFNNSSSNGKFNKNGNNGENDNDDKLPPSGSLFEVRGSFGSWDRWSKLETKKKTQPWWATLLKCIAILGVAALVLWTGGAFSGVAMGLKAGLAIIREFLVDSFVFMFLIDNLTTQMTKGQQVNSETFFSRTDTSFGLLSNTYTRELMYENNKLFAQTDSTYTDTSNGLLYVYYSTIRPEDYYSAYYSYVKIDEVISQDTIDEIMADSSADITNPYIYTFNDHTADKSQVPNFEGYGRYSATMIDGKLIFNKDPSGMYIVEETYKFKLGTYYVASNIQTQVYRPYQQTYNLLNEQIIFSEDETCNKYKKDYDYQEAKNGYYYVRGRFGEDGVYYADGGVSNNLSGTINNIKINGKNWDIDGLSSVEYMKKTFAPADNAKAEEIRHLFESNYGKGIDNGYGWKTNAYYTADGSKLKYYGSNTALVKYGKFTHITDKPSSGRNGVDYITILDALDNEHYYILNEVVPSIPTETQLYIYNSNLPKHEDIKDNSFIVYLYPSSFTNPYNKEVIENDISNATKDTIEYFDVELIGEADTTDIEGLEFDVPYFYYDYEYIVDDRDTNTDVKRTYIRDYHNADDTLPLYNKKSDGSFEQVKINNSDLTYDYIGKNWNICKNYYIYPIDEDIYILGNSGTAKDGVYYVSSTKLFVKDGILQSLQGSFGHGSNSTSNYNYNKFLMNMDYEIFTRYKFQNDKNGRNPFNSGIWEYDDNENNANVKYYLFRDGYAWPNSSKTYLTEGVVVTIGGGQLIYDGTQRHISAGSITVL